MGAVTEKAQGVRVVVCDTGPIFHLHQAGLLDWLAAAGEIYIPQAVEDELSALISDWTELRPRWLRVKQGRTPPDEAMAVLCREMMLHDGEIDAISLAREVKAHWLLTDDATARLVGESLKLEVHGSLGVILWRAAQDDLNPQAARAGLRRLKSTSLWVSDRILSEAAAALDEILHAR